MKTKNLIFMLCGVGASFYPSSFFASEVESELLVCEDKERKLRSDIAVCNGTPAAGVLDPTQDSRVRVLREEIGRQSLPNLYATLGETNTALGAVSLVGNDELITSLKLKKDQVKKQISHITDQLFKKKIAYVENAFSLNRSQTLENVELLFNNLSLAKIRVLTEESKYKGQWAELYKQYLVSKLDLFTNGALKEEEKVKLGNKLLARVQSLPDDFPNKADMLKTLSDQGMNGGDSNPISGFTNNPGSNPISSPVDSSMGNSSPEEHPGLRNTSGAPAVGENAPAAHEDFATMSAAISNDKLLDALLEAQKQVSANPSFEQTAATAFNSLLKGLLEKIKSNPSIVSTDAGKDALAAIAVASSSAISSENIADIERIRDFCDIRSQVDNLINGPVALMTPESNKLLGEDEDKGLQRDLKALMTGVPEGDGLNNVLQILNKDLKDLLGYTEEDTQAFFNWQSLFLDMDVGLENAAKAVRVQIDNAPVKKGNITIMLSALGEPFEEAKAAYNKILGGTRGLNRDIAKKILAAARAQLISKPVINALIQAIHGGILVPGIFVTDEYLFASVSEEGKLVEAKGFVGKGKLLIEKRKLDEYRKLEEAKLKLEPEGENMQPMRNV